MSIDIVEIRIANGQSSSIFDKVNLPATHPYFRFSTITIKSLQTFTKLNMCIDIVEVWFQIAIWYILSIFDRVISPGYNSGGVLLFHTFIYNCEHGHCRFEYLIRYLRFASHK